MDRGLGGGRRACDHPTMTATSPSDFLGEDAEFAGAWNRLARSDRMRLRRLVRVGRRVDDPLLEPLVGAYARHQIARPWVRFFWLWYLPGLVIALGVASQIHPVAIGAVLALGAQAVLAQISLKRAARDEPV
jgi:hypothetical protein